MGLSNHFWICISCTQPVASIIQIVIANNILLWIKITPEGFWLVEEANRIVHSQCHTKYRGTTSTNTQYKNRRLYLPGKWQIPVQPVEKEDQRIYPPPSGRQWTSLKKQITEKTSVGFLTAEFYKV